MSRNSCDVPEPCLPSATVCGVVSVIWPHSYLSQHHEQSNHCRKLPALAGEPSGSSKAPSVHAASPTDVLQNILPAPHISRYGRCDLRTCSCFPEGMNHCHREFQAAEGNGCFSQLITFTALGGGLCQTLCDRYRTLFVGCVLAGLGHFDWLSLWHEGMYDWSINCVSSFCRTLYVQGQTSMSQSK